MLPPAVTTVTPPATHGPNRRTRGAVVFRLPPSTFKRRILPPPPGHAPRPVAGSHFWFVPDPWIVDRWTLRAPPRRSFVCLPRVSQRGRLPAPCLSAGSSLFFRLLFLTYRVHNAANVASSPPSPPQLGSTSAPARTHRCHAPTLLPAHRTIAEFTGNTSPNPTFSAATTLLPRCYPVATPLLPAATRCYTPSPCHLVTHTPTRFLRGAFLDFGRSA